MSVLVSKPPFPNVPALPGVPALPRAPGFVSSAILAAVGFAEGALWAALQRVTGWGVFDHATGQLLADADSVLSVDLHAVARVSDFPVEQGGFATYNKVQMPDLPIVRLTKGGTVSDRAIFLASIDAAKKSLQRVDVHTPEALYLNCTLEDYNYSRRSSGTECMLIVELHLKEIREVSPQFTTLSPPSKSVSAAGVSNSGQVQPAAVPASTLATFKNALGKFGESLVQ